MNNRNLIDEVERKKRHCLYLGLSALAMFCLIALPWQCGCQVSGSQPSLPGDNPVVNYNYNGVPVYWVVLYTIVGVVVTGGVLYGSWKWMEYKYIKPKFRR